MYTQVVVATGSKWVFVSGQQPEDKESDALAHMGPVTHPRVVNEAICQFLSRN